VTAPAQPSSTAKRKRPRKRRFSDPGRTWAKQLERFRPGLVSWVLDRLAERYGQPTWEPRLDATSELILTILTQNSADTNAEVAFEALRATYPSGGEVRPHHPGAGWGGIGLPDGAAPDWAAVERAPLPELVDTIRPGGLANQKAPRIQATLRRIREERGDYELDFLAILDPIEARAWLTSIDGIGKKTASILLLFSFGQPLFPIDRHVERVARRVGLLPAKATVDDGHDLFLGMLGPDRMYEAHVNLIQHGRKVCHAQRPEHDACPLLERCRFVNPKAP
jgi:endonuclease-3